MFLNLDYLLKFTRKDDETGDSFADLAVSGVIFDEISCNFSGHTIDM